jgi:hypothetical protein
VQTKAHLSCTARSVRVCVCVCIFRRVVSKSVCCKSFFSIYKALHHCGGVDPTVLQLEFSSTCSPRSETFETFRGNSAKVIVFGRFSLFTSNEKFWQFMFNALGGIPVRCLVPLFLWLNFPRFKHFSSKQISRFLERVAVLHCFLIPTPYLAT